VLSVHRTAPTGERNGAERAPECRSVLSVVIVDDEGAARRTLREYCDREPDLRVVGDYADGASALEAIRGHPPDLLFLDIQMKPLTGIALAKALPPATAPHIVFVTAHDQFARDAFEVSAVDYLLKPFDNAGFREALERVRHRHQLESLAQHRWALADVLEKLERSRGILRQPRPRIIADSGGRMHVLDVGHIEMIESQRDYVKITVGCDVFTARGTLEHAEATMQSQPMLKISRSRAVNLAHVRELGRTPRGDVILLLSGGLTVTSSERYRESVRQQLSQLQMCVRES
jgi:two-component system LytT family response regulator